MIFFVGDCILEMYISWRRRE